MDGEGKVGRGDGLLRRQGVENTIIAFKFAVATGVQYGVDLMTAQHCQPALNGEFTAGAKTSGGHHR